MTNISLKFAFITRSFLTFVVQSEDAAGVEVQSRLTTFASLSGWVSSCQTCLGIYEHWIVHRLTTAAHPTDRKRHKIGFTKYVM